MTPPQGTQPGSPENPENINETTSISDLSRRLAGDILTAAQTPGDALTAENLSGALKMLRKKLMNRYL